jgi:hypothetical protein
MVILNLMLQHIQENLQSLHQSQKAEEGARPDTALIREQQSRNVKLDNRQFIQGRKTSITCLRGANPKESIVLYLNI